MQTSYVADIQFFRGNNKDIIVKSFSFCKLFEKDIVQHFIFKAPYDISELNLCRRREVEHVARNFHHLEWNEGFIDYQQVSKVICSALGNATEVFVKGLEKVKYLNSILQENVCCNIELLDCPNLKTLKSNISVCNFDNSPVSSLNVYVMKKWLCEYFQNSLTLMNEAIRNCYVKGFFNLSNEELYFLPSSFLTHHFTPDFLQNYYYKFAPHVLRDLNFKKYLSMDSGIDTVN
uniref:Uncharacterized protein n=1 Tax=Cacopsylla melanoneura TaxID=428564 RepID=A0A8D8UPF6_9HEMI